MELKMVSDQINVPDDFDYTTPEQQWPEDFDLGIKTSRYHAWVRQEHLRGADRDWLKEVGVTRQDLDRIFERAKEIVQLLIGAGLLESTEARHLPEMTYDLDNVDWCITFGRHETDGLWNIHFHHREELGLPTRNAAE
jgi:hypothetical protein